MSKFPILKLPIFVLMWAMMVSITAFPLLLIVPFTEYSLWWMILPVGVAPLGLIVVPLLYPFRNTEYEYLPFWTRPWANPEDWAGKDRGNGEQSLPKWWVISRGTGFKSWWRYHAVRNPANGLRSFELLDLTIVPEKVRFIRSKNFTEDRYDVSKIRELKQSTVWFFAWQGLQAGCEIIHIWSDTHHLNIKFGWRVEPADASATHSNIGMEDASFASKILLRRKG